jgi:nucleoid DNA-binding protein
MNKIIYELLNTNARVIIPDFGAFIIKQKNPRLIVFNEFLRYNDGLLIDYIAVSEGVDKSKAKEKVTKFVEEISQILSRGDEVFIDGLGKLVKDSSGKLTFIDENAASDDVQQKGKKPAAKKDVKAAVPPEPKPEQKKKDKSEQEEKEKAEPKKADKSEQEEKEKAEPKKEQILESKSEEEPVEITFEKEDTKPAPAKEEKKPKEEKISVAPVKPAESRVESGRTGQTFVPPGKKPVTKSARKSNSMQIIGWIILIVIVNGAIVAWFLFNDQITGIFKRDKFKETPMATPIETDQESPAAGQDYNLDEATETPAENMVPNETEQDIKAPAKATVSQPVLHDRKEYYIVAGCFREEGNADQLVIELRKKGFQAEKFGKIGNLFAVSFSSFTDKSAALEELKKIRNTEQKEAWIAYF